MAKKKQNAFEDWVGLIAFFPWWVGAVLAVVSYFLLHHLATRPVAPVQPAQISDALTQSVVSAFAFAGQYLVPLVCTVGAAISAWGRRKREQLFADAGVGASASVLNDMSWQEFEMLVGEAFRRGGFSVTETGRGGADGGVDLVLKKGGEKYLVQCKQWRAYKVGVTTVRELYGVMTAAGAAGGFVVTSGVFTQEAKDFAEGRNIELVDGAELNEIIKRVRPQAAAVQPRPYVTLQPGASPSCPMCGNVMVRRTAKKGANAGNQFWGCTNYPQCRGTASIN